VLKSSRWEE